MCHGRIDKAFLAQPFGVVLALALATLGVAGGLETLKGQSFLHKLRPGVWWVWSPILAMLAGWGFVLARGYLMGRLPLR